MTNPIIFADTETTGLYSYAGHEVWEWGSIRVDDWSDFEGWYWSISDSPVEWPEPPVYPNRRTIQIDSVARSETALRMTHADPMAMRINGFFGREHDSVRILNDKVLAHIIFDRTLDCSWVGAVPSFDTIMVSDFLLSSGLMPGGWHYHLIDVESMMMGHLLEREDSPFDSLRLPMKFSELKSLMIGAPVLELSKRVGHHTAFGDAFVVLVLYGWMNGLNDFSRWETMWEFFERELKKLTV